MPRNAPLQQTTEVLLVEQDILGVDMECIDDLGLLLAVDQFQSVVRQLGTLEFLDRVKLVHEHALGLGRVEEHQSNGHVAV